MKRVSVGIALSCLCAAGLLLGLENAYGQFGKMKSLTGAKEIRAEVDQLMERIKMTKEDFEGSTRCLKEARDTLVDFAATSELKAALKQEEDQAKSPEDQERVNVKKEEIINNAQKSGALAQKKLDLDQDQGRHFENLYFNGRLAVLKDKQVLQNAPKINDETQDLIKKIQADKTAMAAVGSKIPELTDATKDIAAITKEVPHQLQTFIAFLSAINDLRKNNKIENEKEPQVKDKFIQQK